jgi:hypothetical protein
VSTSVVHLFLRLDVRAAWDPNKACHLLRHCFFVRPGTRWAILSQPLPLCIFTATLNLVSSSGVQLPVRLFASVMPAFKASRHLLIHSRLVRPGQERCDCIPIFAIVQLHRIRQLGVLRSLSIDLYVPTRGSMLEYNVWPGTSTATAVQSVLRSLPHFFLLLFVTTLASFASSSGTPVAIASPS